MPLDSTAEGSNTPASKSVIITLERAGSGAPRLGAGGQDATGADDGHKRRPQPHQLS